MPTLLQINSLVNKGSTGRITEDIGRFVKSKSWQSHIAYGRASNPSESNTIKVGNAIDIGLHGVFSRILGNHGLNSKRATVDLIKKISGLQPEVIQLHNLHGYYLNYQLLFEFLSQTNIPVVWTFHDCWPFTGHCTYFSDINCFKWKTECDNCPKTKNYPSSLFVDRAKTNYYLKKKIFNSLPNLSIVTVSHWLKELVDESFLKEVNVEVIHNGIDLSSFRPLKNGDTIRKKYGINEKVMLLGVATIWDIRKGWDDYLKLNKVLSNQYVIVLVGISEVQRSKLPPGIIGIQRLENLDELAALYSTADIVLNLSYQETFGLTTVEGFACGTPAIVYNATASPELVTPDTGIIIEPGNIEKLVEAIEVIHSKGKEKYAENCRKLAEQKYDKELRYNDYFNLYNKVIAKA